MFIETPHGKIFCKLIENHRSDPLFLLPGGPGFDHLVYRINQPDFEQNFTTLYHDPIGCGQSIYSGKTNLNIWDNIEHIEKIRAFFNFKKIMLLGTSYGSMVAMGYASLYPEYVSKLILVAGTPDASFLEKAKLNLHNFGTQTQIELCNRYLWTGSFPDQTTTNTFFQEMRSLYSKRVASNPALIKEMNPAIICNYIPLNEAFRSNFWNFNFLEDLKKITAKTLLLTARYDWINPPEFAYQAHERIKDSKLICFETGHAIAYDHYDTYIAECTSFLKS